MSSFVSGADGIASYSQLYMKMGLDAMKEASLAELAWVELIAWQGAADLGRICAQMPRISRKNR